jgi:hypothetical protein
MMTTVTMAAALDPELTSGKLVDVKLSVFVDEGRVVVPLDISSSNPVTVAAAGTNCNCAVAVPETTSATSLDTVIQVEAGSVLHPKSWAFRPGSNNVSTVSPTPR